MPAKKTTTRALKANIPTTSSQPEVTLPAAEPLTAWKPATHIKTMKDAARYLNAAFEEHSDDPAFIAESFGVAARAVGMTKIAKKTGLSRESLYRALSYEGNPEFATILKVAQALGVTFQVAS